MILTATITHDKLNQHLTNREKLCQTKTEMKKHKNYIKK